MSEINSIGLSVPGTTPPVEFSSHQFIGSDRPSNKESARKELSLNQRENKAQAIPDKAALSEQTDKMNRLLNAFNRQLRFELQDDSHKMVIKIVDGETGETIRQIPPEYLAKTVQRIDEALGVILDERA